MTFHHGQVNKKNPYRAVLPFLKEAKNNELCHPGDFAERFDKHAYFTKTKGSKTSILACNCFIHRNNAAMNLSCLSSLPDRGYQIIENWLGLRKGRYIYHQHKPITTIGRKYGMAKKKDKKKDSKKGCKENDVKKKGHLSYFACCFVNNQNQRGIPFFLLSHAPFQKPNKSFLEIRKRLSTLSIFYNLAYRPPCLGKRKDKIPAFLHNHLVRKIIACQSIFLS